MSKRVDFALENDNEIIRFRVKKQKFVTVDNER